MKAQGKVAIVDTTIIPDRNAGIGSLLRDLQKTQDTDRYRRPRLGNEFAFIDVGVSHARVSTTLKTLLAVNLGMEVDYVATELPEVVPYAYVTPLGARAEKIRSYLSGLISTGMTTRKVMEWHYVVDHNGKISSVAYSYNHYGNEVWEAYFMGRTFMISGEKVEFRDPKLDEMIAHDVQKIGERIDLEMNRDSDPGRPGPSWDEYVMEKNPLEVTLAESGITLQKRDVPQRIKGKQNVLYLGNVLNHYPKDQEEQELDRVTKNMEIGDIVIVQVDEEETSFIEVLNVKGHGNRKIRECVRWIDTIKLEIKKPVSAIGSWQQIHLKPMLGQIVSRLVDCLGRKMISPEWSQKEHKILVRQYIFQVLAKFFRAVPSDETLRIAFREVFRRLPYVEDLRGFPVFRDDENDAYGGKLSDLSPIVSEEDIESMKVAIAKVAG